MPDAHRKRELIFFALFFPVLSPLVSTYFLRKIRHDRFFCPYFGLLFSPYLGTEIDTILVKVFVNFLNIKRSLLFTFFTHLVFIDMGFTVPHNRVLFAKKLNSLRSEKEEKAISAVLAFVWPALPDLLLVLTISRSQLHWSVLSQLKFQEFDSLLQGDLLLLALNLHRFPLFNSKIPGEHCSYLPLLFRRVHFLTFFSKGFCAYSRFENRKRSSYSLHRSRNLQGNMHEHSFICYLDQELSERVCFAVYLLYLLVQIHLENFVISEGNSCEK